MEVQASPSVRAYAAEKNVTLGDVATSLKRSVLGKEDIDRFCATPNTNPGTGVASAVANTAEYWAIDHAQFGPISVEPLTRIEQVAEANLSAANAMIPQVTHHDYAEISAIEAFREKVKSEAQQRGVKLTALAFHLRALAECLLKFPRFNASISADKKHLILKQYVHIALAVDTPYGLVVPVLRDVTEKGLWDISSEVSDLVEKAQSRKLRPEEMAGGSITISNLGRLGGTAFTPIVNPPQVAILGLSRSEFRPYWDGSTWQAIPTIPLDLSYDHRIINGADAARFMNAYRKFISMPELMFS